jgi:hypothetical protein
MLTTLGEFDKAATCLTPVDEHVTREDGDTDRSTDALRTVLAPLLSARLHLAAGRLAPAVAHAEAAVVIAGEFGIGTLVPVAIATLAQIALQRGDLRAAPEYAECLQAEPVSLRMPQGPCSHRWLHARIADALHGPAAAMGLLADTYELLPRSRRCSLTSRAQRHG